jgi:hypothetical protein
MYNIYYIICYILYIIYYILYIIYMCVRVEYEQRRRHSINTSFLYTLILQTG